jgi:glycine cleavage system H protein
VTEVNTGLEDEPEKVNDDAQGDGWLFKLKPADSSEFDALMDLAEKGVSELVAAQKAATA